MISLFKNIKQFNYIKFFLIASLFLLSSFYAFKALNNFVYNNEFSKTLSVNSIILNQNKVYLFSTSGKISFTKDTIILPIENKSLPDSICYLFFDKQWKVKLTNNLRNNDEDTVNNIFHPWCCTQEEEPHFFNQDTTIYESILIKKGIKFNYYSGSSSDRLSIKLKKKGVNTMLCTNLPFLNNSIPISKSKENKIEVNFCNSGDTIKNKYVMSLPLLSPNNTSNRKIIKIKDNNILIGDSVIKSNSDEFDFIIDNIPFLLKDNFSLMSIIVLTSIFIFIFLISIYILIRLFYLTRIFSNRNLLIIEQQNILNIRILINSVTLLGFPILILLIKENPQRLSDFKYLLPIMYLLLNVNWIWVYSKIEKTKSGASIIEFISKYTKKINANYILLFIGITLIAIKIFASQEKLFGIFPIIHITKFLYVLMPFVLSSSLVRHIEDFKWVQKLKIPIGYLLILILSIFIAVVSDDYATPLFTFIAIFLLNILQKGNIIFIGTFIKENIFRLLIILTIFLLAVYYFVDSSKIYRFCSTIDTPLNSMYSNINEQSKQTVANQIFLIKSTIYEKQFSPAFNTVLLPSWKSTFFSDYAVLWSFRIGGFLFVFIYMGILLLLSYSIVSILIILNKPIPLHNGNMIQYDKKMVLVFNVLLSLLLVQYTYTFLSNFWVLPVTGQSPGVLCPSYFELAFHLLLINALYYFIDKKIVVEMPDTERYPIVYTKIKKKTLGFIGGVFILSIVGLLIQAKRIVSLKDEMKWNSIESKDIINSTDSLNYLALNAYKLKDKILFKKLHTNYFNTEDLNNSSFKVSTNSIIYNTTLDSITKFTSEYIPTINDSLFAFHKSINSKPVNFINNPLYSGCPILSTTINFNLQKYLNEKLANWANNINTHNSNSHIMLGGAIIIASNDSGNIVSSASYPMLFNENRYHLRYYEAGINKATNLYDNMNHQPLHTFRFKYSDVEKYINFAEYDQIQGSIVKPLLAYCGLSMLPQNNALIQRSYLQNFLGKSLPIPARELFRTMANINLDSLKRIYLYDFGISQFYDLSQTSLGNFNDATYQGYAIGQRNKLIFKDVVQAYTRIKTGRKVRYRYFKTDTVSTQRLSLNPIKLATLQNSMKFALTTGTAKNVGSTLRANGINYFPNNFLAKTGTPQIDISENHNRTSSFIIVSNNYTIGIQLFGDLPNNVGGYTARHLFIQLIPELKRLNIL